MNLDAADFSVDAYDFELPEALIAQRPVSPRDSSRLLVVNRKTGTWEHKVFKDICSFFTENDLIVANNTKVIKARLLGNRLIEQNGKTVQGGKIEFLMLEEVEPLTWEGAFRSTAKQRPGVVFEVPTPGGQPLRGELIRGASESVAGTVIVRFDRDPVSCGAGEIPLPHYIKRSAQAEDVSSYQTIYATRSGSAAAPTAGLHFSDEIRDKLRCRGVEWKEITLHVGLGTFRPVKALDIREHHMHEERYEIDERTAGEITEAKRGGKRVIAVGTTTVRTLESGWDSVSGLRAGAGRTSIFIRPGAHSFGCVDGIITNFHLPKSTLLMLVSAFAGRELILAAYRDAVLRKYRFFSYGDAMLIL